MILTYQNKLTNKRIYVIIYIILLKGIYNKEVKGKMNINDLLITGVSADERETTINFSRTDKEAEVYTSDNTVLTKIKNMFNSDDCEWKLKDVVKDQDGNVVGVFFIVPKKLISLRAKTMKSSLTDEQRRAAAERLKNARNFQ